MRRRFAFSGAGLAGMLVAGLLVAGTMAGARTDAPGEPSALQEELRRQHRWAFLGHEHLTATTEERASWRLELRERFATELAERLGVEPAAVQSALRDLLADRLATAVEAGRLSRERADELLAAYDAGRLGPVLVVAAVERGVGWIEGRADRLAERAERLGQRAERLRERLQHFRERAATG